MAYQIISYVTMLFSLLNCKIIGLELFGVLQLAYFSISNHDFVNIYLGPLKYMKLSNGFNLKLF